MALGKDFAVRTPETSRLFSKWTNPKNGVASYILTGRVAPVQKHFYFTNRSYTDDGRYLWVMCFYPPTGGRHAVPVMGVVDFERDEMRVYHETQSGNTPVVDLRNGDLYWINNLDIWKRGPGVNDTPVRINSFPKELTQGRTPERLATHLFFSADGKSLCIDARFGNETYIGDMPLDGSPFRLWQKLEGFYDHAMFSPTEADLIMFAYEYWQDHKNEPFDGLKPYHRLWMIRRGQKAEPILKAPVSHSGHEWFDPDGKHIWYVHYGVGTKKVNLATREEVNMWPGHLAHSYSDDSGRYLVTDRMGDPKVCDCIVEFRDTVTGKEVEIVNRPPLAADLTQCEHLHPHPQFCLNDKYICHTTTVHERVDVALVPTEGLIERTR